MAQLSDGTVAAELAALNIPLPGQPADSHDEARLRAAYLPRIQVLRLWHFPGGPKAAGPGGSHRSHLPLSPPMNAPGAVSSYEYEPVRADQRRTKEMGQTL